MNRIAAAICVACIALILAPTVDAQTTTVTTSINWAHNWYEGQSCGYWGPGTLSATYRDTAGGDWASLVVRIPMAANRDNSFNLPGPPTVTIAINGQQVGDPVTITNFNTWPICSIHGTSQIYEFRTDSYLSDYHPNGDNIFSVTIGNNGMAGGLDAELTFTTYTPNFAFEYSQGQPEQRMLIHKYRSEETYPSPYQMPTSESDRPRFRFPGKVEVNGAGAARNVWFRVIDPADSSGYVPTADRVPNDNKDPKPRGILMPVGCSNSICAAAPGAPIMIRSNSFGLNDVVLEATAQVAGDNYQIEASFDATFSCATAGPSGNDVCPKSAVVTAWKRILVEKKNMFRRGANIIEDANVGDDRVAVSDATPFAPGQAVALIHAPLRQVVLDQSLPIPATPVGYFYTETNVVDSIEPATATKPAYLVFQRRLGVPFGPDRSVTPSLEPYLCDGVGVVTGSLYTDFFVANPAYFQTPFNAAFVEYVDAPQVITAIPNQPATVPEYVLGHIASKWYENSVRGTNMRLDNLSNRRQLIGTSALLADDRQTGGARLGRTLSSSHNPSFVFVERIEHAVTEVINGRVQNVHGLDPDRVNGEVTAHELVHQWDVNPNAAAAGATDGHCLDVDYLGSAFCLMHGPFFNPLHNNELGDGNVVLHYRKLLNGTIDSEYITIRSAAEPMPRH